MVVKLTSERIVPAQPLWEYRRDDYVCYMIMVSEVIRFVSSLVACAGVTRLRLIKRFNTHFRSSSKVQVMHTSLLHYR